MTDYRENCSILIATHHQRVHYQNSTVHIHQEWHRCPQGDKCSCADTPRPIGRGVSDQVALNLSRVVATIFKAIFRLIWSHWAAFQRHQSLFGLKAARIMKCHIGPPGAVDKKWTLVRRAKKRLLQHPASRVSQKTLKRREPQRHGDTKFFLGLSELRSAGKKSLPLCLCGSRLFTFCDNLLREDYGWLVIFDHSDSLSALRFLNEMIKDLSGNNFLILIRLVKDRCPQKQKLFKDNS